jgi:hypothetical protein
MGRTGAGVGSQGRPRGARPRGEGPVGRDAKKRRGSTYPNRAPSRRTPRWRPPWAVDRARRPSRVRVLTCAPRWTKIVDRGNTVARQWPHSTVTTPPLDPMRPATATRPAHGDRTTDPPGARRSTPRCRPPSYGFAPRSNPRATGALTGNCQAAAAGAGAVRTMSRARVNRRTCARLRAGSAGGPGFRCIGTLSSQSWCRGGETHAWLRARGSCKRCCSARGWLTAPRGTGSLAPPGTFRHGGQGEGPCQPTKARRARAPSGSRP